MTIIPAAIEGDVASSASLVCSASTLKSKCNFFPIVFFFFKYFICKIELTWAQTNCSTSSPHPSISFPSCPSTMSSILLVERLLQKIMKMKIILVAFSYQTSLKYKGLHVHFGGTVNNPYYIGRLIISSWQESVILRGMKSGLSSCWSARGSEEFKLSLLAARVCSSAAEAASVFASAGNLFKFCRQASTE